MADVAEHFCTLFDIGFLPQGLSLYTSLERYAPAFRLWIVCMDEQVETALRDLELPHVELIPLREVETEKLVAASHDRTRVEYCWTLTPFAVDVALERAESVDRMTYLDADLFFFDSPALILEEFAASGKDVLLTEHAYAPEYDQTVTSGRFCVQFITFRRTAPGLSLLRRWEAQCLDWCYARPEDGKFGDQKYLDVWPVGFGDHVHVFAQPKMTLAPWNVRHFERLHGTLKPVFFHFHGLRRVSRRYVRLRGGYRIGATGRWLYAVYLTEFRAALNRINAAGISIPSETYRTSVTDALRIGRLLAKRLTVMARL